MRFLRHTFFVLSALLLCACQQPSATFTDQHGHSLDARNHWLVVNYWATWCAPCRKEIPELNALAAQLTAKNISILGVNFDQLAGAELIHASQSLGIQFPVIIDDLTQRYNLPTHQGLPVTHIISPQGTLVETLIGEQSQASILQALQRLQAL